MRPSSGVIQCRQRGAHAARRDRRQRAVPPARRARRARDPRRSRDRRRGNRRRGRSPPEPSSGPEALRCNLAPASTGPSRLARALRRRLPEIDLDHVVVRFRALPPDISSRLAHAGARIARSVPGTPWTELATPNGSARQARVEAGARPRDRAGRLLVHPAHLDDPERSAVGRRRRAPTWRRSDSIARGTSRRAAISPLPSSTPGSTERIPTSSADSSTATTSWIRAAHPMTTTVTARW